MRTAYQAARYIKLNLPYSFDFQRTVSSKNSPNKEPLTTPVVGAASCFKTRPKPPPLRM